VIEGTNTRARIQAIALELFTEQGYEKTSLREIAERLGVTKAALYYHFKSKDDIVISFVQDRIDRLDELIRWAADQPATAAGRQEILGRYLDDFFSGQERAVMRFFEQNQTVLKSLTIGQRMREGMIQMAEILVGPDKSPSAHLRASLALFAVHSSWFTIRGAEITDEERRQAALEVARELLDRIGGEREAGDRS
jgi:AcrR family transcriptional regulator